MITDRRNHIRMQPFQVQQDDPRLLWTQLEYIWAQYQRLHQNYGALLVWCCMITVLAIGEAIALGMQ